jgi:hypothetical protein
MCQERNLLCLVFQFHQFKLPQYAAKNVYYNRSIKKIDIMPTSNYYDLHSSYLGTQICNLRFSIMKHNYMVHTMHNNKKIEI